MRNERILKRNQKNNSSVQVLDAYEYEDEGFSEGGVVKGKTVASFSFSLEGKTETDTVKVPCQNTGTSTGSNSSPSPSPISISSTSSRSDLSAPTCSGFIRKGFSFSEGASRSSAAKTNGQTPLIDGEAFSIKRGYQFRPSTIRKLRQLKASHADINVYLNTIIDEAILFYYNHKVAVEEAAAVSHDN